MTSQHERIIIDDEPNDFIFQKGFSSIVTTKNGEMISMIKFPDNMDLDEWNVVKEGIDHWLSSEDKIRQIRKDRQIRLGLDLMEKLHN